MMPVLLPYVLKSMSISAVLFGYYLLFLRNRPFHRYNRVYLLSTVVFAVVMPLVPMPGLSLGAGLDEAPVLSGALHSIVPGNWNENGGAGILVPGSVDWRQWMVRGYVLIALWPGILFVRELLFVLGLYRRYPRERRGNILFLLTREPGTPFSFLKTIFWNTEIDMQSEPGRQILRHELIHVRQRHTLDLLVLRPLLIVFWCNPVLYLIYRELRTIHEFEADASATDGGDRYAYAELLLWQTVGGRRQGLFHTFFSSSIKRRITMIIQSSSVAPGLSARLLALPLSFLLFCGFSRSMAPPARPKPSAKPITVVIDAGHGGSDAGAIASNGLKEKNINLTLARKVKELSAAYGINVILTRDGDELAGGKKTVQASLHYRTDLTAAKKADLFISLHTDANSGVNEDGFHIYLSKENVYYQQSAKLGSLLIDALKPSYTTGEELRENEGHVWVLRASPVPAVLILCGNIDNERDRAFISNGANQEKIARDILDAITHYKS